jgi:Flp pilus assembly protein TadD
VSSFQPASKKIRQFLSSLSDADLQELSAWFAAGQSGMVQLNADNAKGFQVQVQGGTAYIGDQYSIDVDTLAQALETLLHDRQLPRADRPHNLPYSGVTQFVGRQNELDRLHQQLQPGSPVAISAVSGMGGIGKTELALEYARQHYRTGTYPGGICWLRAREDVAAQIVSFARSLLNLTPPDDLELAEQVRWCWGRWQEGAALVILDDVQDYGEVQSFLPPSESRFQVLMTTRSQFGPPVQEIRLDVLSEAEALELLRLLVPDERIDRELAQAKQLCDWLGYLPLGLELVGRYLAEDKDLSVQELWQELQDQRIEAEALKREEDMPTASLGVLAAFELSWQKLTADAQQLAAVLSLFALVEIPWNLVVQCLPEVNEAALRKLRNKQLLKLNLLKRVDQGMYQLHQLLREFFAVKRSHRADDADLQQQFYQVVITEAERVRDKPERSFIKESTLVIAHLQVAIELLARPEQALDLATCLNWIASLYYEQGRYIEAEPLHVRSLSIREQQLGKDHPKVAESLNNLALLYYSQGLYAKAEPLCRQSLSIWEQELGKDHPDVAVNLNNLALLYNSQGRYGEAESLYVRALSIREQQLGKDHFSVANSLNNLARLYDAQGRYIEAEPLHVRSLSIREQQLGKDHPKVAESLNNLALLYYSQGLYAKAEPLCRRSLSILKRQLGKDHPLVASSLSNLARLYRSQARYVKAELLFQRSISILQNQLSADHPIRARVVSHLAHLYDLQGRYSEAESLYLQALPILLAKLGENHEWTQKAAKNWRSFLQNVIQDQRTDELSDDPMTQTMLQELRDSWD